MSTTVHFYEEDATVVHMTGESCLIQHYSVVSIHFKVSKPLDWWCVLFIDLWLCCRTDAARLTNNVFDRADKETIRRLKDRWMECFLSFCQPAVVRRYWLGKDKTLGSDSPRCFTNLPVECPEKLQRRAGAVLKTQHGHTKLWSDLGFYCWLFKCIFTLHIAPKTFPQYCLSWKRQENQRNAAETSGRH